MRRFLDWLNDRYYRRVIGSYVAPRDIRPFRPEDKRIRDEFHRAYYSGWYREVADVLPRVENGQVFPLDGPGLGLKLKPEVLTRPDAIVRMSKL